MFSASWRFLLGLTITSQVWFAFGVPPAPPAPPVPGPPGAPGPPGIPGPTTKPTTFPFDVTTISAPDGSITARFISLGSTLTELWVKDKHGKFRDIILGYDDNTMLLSDPLHPYFGPIVGRYANRIKNGTFSIPISKNPPASGPNVFHIPENDHNGLDTLHGGFVGYDRHNWTVSAKSPTSVTFKHVDNGDENFPGTVTVFATHTVLNGGKLQSTFKATATKQTPIMLAQHAYFNLDAFQDGTTTILDHHLQIDASKVVAIDSILIPTGKFIDARNTVFDFRKEQKIGARFNETVGLCGPGCQGYDHCWVYDGNKKTQLSLWSDKSGIRMDISSNQIAAQLYSGNSIDEPRKAIHGGPSLRYGLWSAVVIEQESIIDAINNPEFGVDQIYGPNRPYEWTTTLSFSINK